MRSHAEVPVRWGRSILFRLAALMLVLLLLMAADFAIGLILPKRVYEVPDAFVSFRSIRPLFVANESTGRYETAADRLVYFRPDSFELNKQPGAYRVFCLGGSTVQGRPFALETAFSTWLALALSAADPKREFEVVNCGGISYASYRLVPILDEVLAYEPDLIVLYTGHNEFLEDRTYREAKQASEFVVQAQRLASRTNFYHLVRYAMQESSGDSPPENEAKVEQDPFAPDILETEVTASLDHKGGLAEYHRDLKWQADIARHFRASIEGMIARCKAAGVPLILINPTENLRDCPPFKSEHRAGLTQDELKQWRHYARAARELMPENPRAALAELLAAVEIDDLHAGLHYRLGRCYDALLMPQKAEASYRRALEMDVCPLRMTEPLHEALLVAAADSDTPLIDVRQMFQQLSANGIPGDEMLIDHVHPSITGHQRIATAIAELLAEWGVVRPNSDWADRRKKRYEEHLATLDSLYFFKGLQNRENLRAWADGRAAEFSK